MGVAVMDERQTKESQDAPSGIWAYRQSPVRLQAIERRRQARRAVKVLKERGKAPTNEERRARDEEIVLRLIGRRERGGLPVVGLHGDIRYWHLRRLGYDVLQEECRVVFWRGKPYAVPAEVSPMWTWWCRISWKARYSLLDLIRRQDSARDNEHISLTLWGQPVAPTDATDDNA